MYNLKLDNFQELCAVKRALKCTLMMGRIEDKPMDRVFTKVKEMIKNA